MAELDLAFSTAKVLSVDTIAALLKLMSQAGRDADPDPENGSGMRIASLIVSQSFKETAVRSILRSILFVGAVAIVAGGFTGCNRSGTGNSETPKTTAAPAPSAAQMPGATSAASQ